MATNINVATLSCSLPVRLLYQNCHGVPSLGPLFILSANYFHFKPGKPEEILWFLEPKLEALERPSSVGCGAQDSLGYVSK